MKWKVNKSLLPMKGHFFLWNAGTAPVVPFLSVYARQLGFSSFIVGLIYTILPIVGMLAKPTAGAIADRYRSQKVIFLVMMLVTAGGFLSILYVPEIPVEKSVHFSCDNGEAVFDTCVLNKPEDKGNVEFEYNTTVHCQLGCKMEPEYWQTVCKSWSSDVNCSEPSSIFSFQADVPSYYIEKMGKCLYFKVARVTLPNGKSVYPNCPTSKSKISTICDINCDNYKVNEAVEVSELEDDVVYGLFQFWLFLSLMVIAWFGQAIVVSVGDAICFEILGDEPSKYGQQRCFGALGWGIFAIFAGLIVDWASNGQAKKDYTYVFYLAFVILLSDFILCYRLKYEQKNLSTSILKDVGHLLLNIRIVVFMGWCIFVGLCTGLMWNFLFWLVEDLASKQENHDDWLKTLQGLLMATQCLFGELPFFFLSGWILRRIGHVYSMSLILLVIGIRFILYSVIKNPWFFLPVELCNGLTFGLFYAAMASYACVIAPPGTATTVQGLVGAVFEGIGVSLGSFIGGILFRSYGGPMTFRIFGIASLIACLIHTLVQHLLNRRSGGQDSMTQYAPPQDALFMVDDANVELQLVK